MAEAQRCHVGRVLLGLLALVAAGGVSVLHLLSWYQQWTAWTNFGNTSGSVWELYHFDIVETDCIFYINIVVYALQLVWLFYALVAVSWWTSQSKLNPHLYPTIIPCYVFIAFILGLGGVLGWVLLRTLPTAGAYSIAPIGASVLMFCVAIGGSVRAGGRYHRMMQPDRSHCHVWGVRVIVYNGLILMATWTNALAMYNLASLLQQHGVVSLDIAEYIAVGIIMAFLALWWSIEVFLTNPVTGWVVTPYFLSAVLFAMSLIKNFNERNMHFDIGTVFLAFATLLLLLKMCAVRQWQCTQPAANDMYVLNKSANIKKQSLTIAQKTPAMLDTPAYCKTALPVELKIQNELLYSAPNGKASYSIRDTSKAPSTTIQLPQSPNRGSTGQFSLKTRRGSSGQYSLRPTDGSTKTYSTRPHSEPPKDCRDSTLPCRGSTLPRLPPKKGQPTGGGKPINVMRF